MPSSRMLSLEVVEKKKKDGDLGEVRPNSSAHPKGFQVKSVLLKLGKNSVLVLYRCKVLLEQVSLSPEEPIQNTR